MITHPSAASAAGRIFPSAKALPASWNICCSSSGVTSKSPLDLPFFWRAGLPSCCAALKVRPAAVAVRNIDPVLAMQSMTFYIKRQDPMGAK